MGFSFREGLSLLTLLPFPPPTWGSCQQKVPVGTLQKGQCFPSESKSNTGRLQAAAWDCQRWCPRAARPEPCTPPPPPARHHS